MLHCGNEKGTHLMHCGTERAQIYALVLPTMQHLRISDKPYSNEMRFKCIYNFKIKQIKQIKKSTAYQTAFLILVYFVCILVTNQLPLTLVRNYTTIVTISRIDFKH